MATKRVCLLFEGTLLGVFKRKLKVPCKKQQLICSDSGSRRRSKLQGLRSRGGSAHSAGGPFELVAAELAAVELQELAEGPKELRLASERTVVGFGAKTRRKPKEYGEGTAKTFLGCQLLSSGLAYMLSRQERKAWSFPPYIFPDS